MIKENGAGEVWPPLQPDGLIREQLRIVFMGAGRTQSGQAATVLALANSHCQLEAQLRPDQCGNAQYPLTYGDVVAVKALPEQSAQRREPGTPRLAIQRIRLLDPDEICFEALLPQTWVVPTQVPALTLLLQSLNAVSHRAIRRFLVDVLLNANTALGLLTVPASCRHHHAFPGGLLEHTVDMLIDFQQHQPRTLEPILQDLMRALIVVHDIGKTVTHASGAYTGRGEWQPHEPAGLELLASPLATLDRNAPKLAHFIRATFKPARYHPKKRHYLHDWLSRLDRRSVSRKPIHVDTLKEPYHALSDKR